MCILFSRANTISKRTYMKKFFYVCQTVSKFTRDIEIKMYKKVLLYPSNSFEVYPLFFLVRITFISLCLIIYYLAIALNDAAERLCKSNKVDVLSVCRFSCPVRLEFFTMCHVERNSPLNTYKVSYVQEAWISSLTTYRSVKLGEDHPRSRALEKSSGTSPSLYRYSITSFPDRCHCGSLSRKSLAT